MTIVSVRFPEGRRERVWRIFINMGRLLPTLEDLHQAIRLKDADRVLMLTGSGCLKINSSLRSCTALSLAVYQGDMKIVQILLEKGAEVDKLSRDWNQRIETPLFTACRLGHQQVARLLLEHGADSNATDLYNHSPLWIATRERNILLVQLLVQSGANLNIADKWSQCPLYMATKYYGRAEIAVYLIQHGCQLDLADMDGRGPFYWCLVNGMDGLARLLCVAGVHISLKDRHHIRHSPQLRSKPAWDWLPAQFNQPRTLLNLCVKNIRQTLSKNKGGSSIWDSIEALQVPNSLQSVLKLEFGSS